MRDPAPEARATPLQRTHHWASELFRWLGSPANSLLLMLSLLSLVFVVLLIRDQGADTPFWDQWVTDVPLVLKAYDGDLHASDLVVQRNEHRSLWANVVSLFVAYTSDWNIKVGLYANVALGLLEWLTALALYRRRDPGAVTLVMLPFALLLFTLRQRMNWVFIRQVDEHTAFYFPLLAMFLLTAWAGVREWLAVTLAAACCLAATFSFSAGLLSWAVLPVVMWGLGYRRGRYFAFWGSAALAAAALFFWGWDSSRLGVGPRGEAHGLVTDPVQILHFVFNYIGGPFVPFRSDFGGLALTLGLCGAGLFVANAVCLRRLELDGSRMVVWLGLAGYSLATAFLMGLGRSRVIDDAPHVAYNEWYVLPETFFWLGFVAILALLVGRVRSQPAAQRSARSLVQINVFFAVVLAGCYLFANHSTLLRRPYVTASDRLCVQRFPTDRNLACFIELISPELDLQAIMNDLDRLAVAGWSSYRDESLPRYAAILPLAAVGEKSPVANADVGFRIRRLGNRFSGRVLVAPPPSEVAFTVRLPATTAKIELRSGIWVDPDHVDETEPQDGAAFMLSVRTADGAVAPLLRGVQDPRVHRDVRPVNADLSAYAGQEITLRFETAAGDSPDTATAAWVDPTVIVYRE